MAETNRNSTGIANLVATPRVVNKPALAGGMARIAHGIVASAADEDVNMIFGAVIKEELEDEIHVTVIATGFDEQREPRRSSVKTDKEDVKIDLRPFNVSDNLDIPTFLRNRKRR